MKLGIDQSYRSTGYCVLDHDRLVSYGIITSNKDDSIFNRAKNIADSINYLLSDYPDITTITLEGLPFGIRGNATRDLAGLQFVIVYSLLTHHRDKEYYIVAPTSVKKHATGSGKAKKEDMVEALPENIRNEFTAHYKKSKGLYDITDAYWLAKYDITD